MWRRGSWGTKRNCKDEIKRDWLNEQERDYYEKMDVIIVKQKIKGNEEKKDGRNNK